MKNIKVVAFDLGGVLLKEKDYQLSQREDFLERKFGKINTNKEYFSWATSEFGVPVCEIESSLENIIDNIYELREPDILDKLPQVKFAIASNHLSLMNKWFDKNGLRSRFECILISGDVELEKPNSAFYRKLIELLDKKPEEILFIDDNEENIKGAAGVGLTTLHYKDRSKSLTSEILEILSE